MTKSQFICFEMPSEDILAAQRAYSNWEYSRVESPVDFVMRKRSVDLSLLLNEVIENELNKTEQSILQMFYYEKLSVSEIAKELCLNRSSVSRRLEAINEKIFCNLKYAVKLRYDRLDDCIFPLALREAFALCALQKSNPRSIGARIFRLRSLSKISCDELSKSIGIDIKRLSEIECGDENITVREAVCLCAYFNVSTDYILTGKQNNTGGQK